MSVSSRGPGLRQEEPGFWELPVAFCVLTFAQAISSVCRVLRAYSTPDPILHLLNAQHKHACSVSLPQCLHLRRTHCFFLSPSFQSLTLAML